MDLKEKKDRRNDKTAFNFLLFVLGLAVFLVLGLIYFPKVLWQIAFPVAVFLIVTRT